MAAIALLALFEPVGALLEYRREAWLVEPWRVLTANWVHVNAKHVLLNAVVWLVFARLFSPELGARRQLIGLITGGVTIGVGLAVFYPSIQWYRGASGTMFTLYFIGATCWLLSSISRSALKRMPPWALPFLLVLGGWVKVLVELPRGDALPVNAWLGASVVPQAHLLGALAGTLCALVFAWLDRHSTARSSSPPHDRTRSTHE